jgi:hypothetical protein
MNGIASLPTKRFQKGGLSDTAIGGLFSPVAQVGPLSVTPANVIGLVAPPAIAAPLAVLSAYNTLTAKQDPAPVRDAKTAAEVEAQQDQMDADIGAVQDAEDAAAGLAAMNQQQAQEQAEEDAAPSPAAVSAAVTAAQDAVDSVDAAEGAAAAAAAAAAGGGGGGGDAPGAPGTTGNETGAQDQGGSSNTGSDAGSDGASPSYQYGGRVMNYEQGGITSLANQVQSQGRGQDKMLVHMTPREVQGLQYLAMRHGGSLSVNPRTGLVEAGFLSSILPMVAGAALTIGSGGVINPYMSAAIVGGVSGLASGSLSKGLMAGLGAFGGAGLGAGLAGAGTATAPLVTGTEAGLSSAADMAASNLSPELLNSPVTTGTSGIDPGLLEGRGLTPSSSYFKMAQSNIDPGLLEGMTAQQVATAPVLSATPAIAPSPTVGFERAGEGLKNVAGFGTPEQVDIARSRFMTDVGGITGLASKAGAAAAPILAGGFGDDDGLKKPEQFIRPFRYETGRQNVPYRTGERGESTAEQAYFDSRLTPVGVYKAGTEPAYGTYAMGGSIEEGVKNGDIRAFDDEYGQDEYYGGGLTALAAGGSPNKPRFLMGKGDGMSDSIPATINDTQPARLADGEFVIPADVVSHLGNGSSKAGAAKLHSMMNRIRKARTGKKRQAPEVRAERYMPA